MKNEFEEIGKVIRRVRMEAQLSQINLATKLNLSPSLINQWESGGKKPSLVDAFRMEFLLELADEPISQLIIGTDYRTARGGKLLADSKPFLTHRVGPTTGTSGVENESQLKKGGEAKVISIPVKMPREVYLRLEFE